MLNIFILCDVLIAVQKLKERLKISGKNQTFIIGNIQRPLAFSHDRVQVNDSTKCHSTLSSTRRIHTYKRSLEYLLQLLIIIYLIVLGRKKAYIKYERERKRQPGDEREESRPTDKKLCTVSIVIPQTCFKWPCMYKSAVKKYEHMHAYIVLHCTVMWQLNVTYHRVLLPAHYFSSPPSVCLIHLYWRSSVKLPHVQNSSRYVNSYFIWLEQLQLLFSKISHKKCMKCTQRIKRGKTCRNKINICLLLKFPEWKNFKGINCTLIVMEIYT